MKLGALMVRSYLPSEHLWPQLSFKIDSKMWHRLKNGAFPLLAVVVINNPVTVNQDARLQIAQEGNYSGQY